MKAILPVLSLILFGQFALASEAPVQSSVAFKIEPQALGDALNEFAHQSGMQLMVNENDIPEGKIAPRVEGELSPEAALQRLLAGSGLKYEFMNRHTVAIGSVSNEAKMPVSSVAPGVSELRLVQSETPAQADSSSEKLEEIVVTAQKKTERLQDVPVPVTAINANALVNSSQLQLQEYYTRIPGLSITLGGDGAAPQATVRGITTGGFSNPTVGIVVDEVSYGSSTSQGSGFTVPDIDPSDLARVEVLRGPQGTLYGASSMGGLLKYVTVEPSIDRLSGRIQAGLSSVRNGDELGHVMRGSINVPLADTFAVRASGFTRRSPGYIDNAQTGKDGVNLEDADGGHLSALWRPSNTLSLKLSALLQDLNRHGASDVYVQPGLGDLEQSTLRGTGEYRNKIQAYSANLAAQVGRGELTSVSGYSVNSVATNLDGTPVLGGLTALVTGVAGTPDPVHSRTEKFSQELRFSMPLGPRLDWLLGAFYTHEDIAQHQSFQAADPDTGEVIATVYDARSPYQFKEYALFSNLTIHLTDRFDLQLGGRESENRQDYSSVATGDFIPYLYPGNSSPLVTQAVHSKERAFTYLVTPQLRLSSDLMVYARLASGYRPGGPTPNSAALGLPAEYGSDETRNYEIGFKGSVLDRALSFDASVYWIDWRDMQVQLRDPSFTSYLANGGRAKSQGVELSMESQPLRGLTVSGWVAWNEAKLSEDFPLGSAAVGLDGDRLPYSARISGNLSIDKEFAMTDRATGSVGASLSYIGDRLGIFASSFANPPLRQTFGAYAKADIRAALQYDSWTLTAFVNNVTDRRGVLRGGLDNLIVPTAFNYIQPRTVGLALARSFGGL